MALSQSHLAGEPLQALLAAGRSYDFLNAALARLLTQPADDALRLMSAREFVRLGLFGPARELLEAASTEVRAHSEIGGLLQSLPVRGGAVPWCRWRSRFEANLTVLEDRGVDVRLISDAWSKRLESFELYTDSRGNDQVRMIHADGSPAWIPCLGDHARLAAAAPLPPDHGELMPGPYLLSGVGLGWYVPRLHSATRDTFIEYSSAIYVLEPQPELLAMALHLHDWRAMLADERVMLFLGADAGSGLCSALAKDPNLPPPRFCLHLMQSREGCDPEADRLIDLIMRDRTERVRVSHSGLEELYAGRDAAYWARRFDVALSGAGSPLRILATVSTHTSFLQYCMRDVARAARQWGHQFEIITESRPFEAVGPLTIHEHVRRFEPDLLFVIDHLRSGFRAAIPSNLPVMTWDQDALQHVFTAENVGQMSPLDVIVGMPHVDCVVRMGRDRRQFLAAQLAASPEQFDGTGLTEEELAPYRCDVSYVSHGSQTADEFFQSEFAALGDDHARRLFTELYPIARSAAATHGVVDGGILRAVLEEAERRSGVRVVDPAIRDRIIGWHLWRLCDRLYRHEALQWVADWAVKTNRTFRIYGKGWEHHPVLAPFSAGPIENGRPLLALYRASAINLQIMPAGFIHQRALDGLLAGGFFMARRAAGDACDPDVRRVAEGVRRGVLNGGRLVHECSDRALVESFERARKRFGYSEAQLDDVYHTIMFDAQLSYAAEVFGPFEQIAFDSAESFAIKADQFLTDAALRDGIARQMRETVLREFSYQARLQMFLRFHLDYLCQITLPNRASSVLVEPSRRNRARTGALV